MWSGNYSIGCGAAAAGNTISNHVPFVSMFGNEIIHSSSLSLSPLKCEKNVWWITSEEWTNWSHRWTNQMDERPTQQYHAVR